MEWCVYMLHCCDGTLYTGSTNRLEQRVLAHAQGRGAKYTRSRRPVELIYQETAAARSAALRREAPNKRLCRQEKMNLIKKPRPAGGVVFYLYTLGGAGARRTAQGGTDQTVVPTGKMEFNQRKEQTAWHRQCGGGTGKSRRNRLGKFWTNVIMQCWQ